MLEGKGKVSKASVQFARHVAYDSEFPFKQGEKVNVRIEKDKLIIEHLPS